MKQNFCNVSFKTKKISPCYQEFNESKQENSRGLLNKHGAHLITSVERDFSSQTVSQAKILFRNRIYSWSNTVKKKLGHVIKFDIQLVQNFRCDFFKVIIPWDIRFIQPTDLNISAKLPKRTPWHLGVLNSVGDYTRYARD